MVSFRSEADVTDVAVSTSNRKESTMEPKEKVPYKGKDLLQLLASQ
jgi:hypothetical protein